ncbi:hypothetical protein SAMN05444166_1115 [Singulisphaera sp. GP187]|uniref:hypothetical protein n=1 Tax=Singulisphaera sp. GP187 TaxID=1882752 RepID=UPI000929F794|nr:hypothetical protein [Singulisphaera sp. GP187]SIN82400.1 hypothetical protein SAMN05444166_1115 [Singulisphaera sp. GP187]
MVRNRPLVIRTLAIAITIALALTLAIGAKASGAPADKSEPPTERLPYRIEASIRIDPKTRIDARSRDRLFTDWLALVHRFVGAPWDLTIAKDSAADFAAPLESLDPKSFASISTDRDKVWVIRLEPAKAGYALSGREFDVSTGRLGPTLQQSVPIVDDLPRGLLRLALDLFSPIADLVEHEAGGATLAVRGAAIEPASPVGRVVGPGSIFQPVRLVFQPDGSTRIMNLPFSYLKVETLEGARARCTIVSAFRDPFTQRIARKNKLIALGAKPADRPTRLKFVIRPDMTPAAGYVLTARTLPDGPSREVGISDRQGRIVLEPGFASELVVIRLLAGNIEPMVELPMMPGESATERTIPFVAKPATIVLEAQLDSLRDTVIDLVAVRARLEARLKARTEGEDWAGVETTLNEFTKLTARDSLASKLTTLKDEATRQQAISKTAILTKTAQAQIAEIQALIDRYLDDEIVRSYSEALQASRDAAVAQTKAAARKKAAAPPPRNP